MTRIALFGSSFNPPHIGHAAVIKDLIQSENFDEVWLIPVWRHPFAKDLAPFEIRLKMLELLLNEIQINAAASTVKISSIEKDIGISPSYTFNTVTELKKRFPRHQFTIVGGTDVKRDLPKWHRSDELQNIADFYFIERGGETHSPYPKVSSTEIREKLKNGKTISGLTVSSVEKYLLENKPY